MRLFPTEATAVSAVLPKQTQTAAYLFHSSLNGSDLFYSPASGKCGHAVGTGGRELDKATSYCGVDAMKHLAQRVVKARLDTNCY